MVMNKVILIGRLTKDPDVRQIQNNTVARYMLAVDRKIRKDNADQNAVTADFISCVAWDRKAEFADMYLKKGTKIAISGHIQTGKYTNKDGQTVYTTDVVIDEQEFCESKAKAEEPADQKGMVSIPDDLDVPFK
jgi:single-strand DNA-binding protein